MITARIVPARRRFGRRKQWRLDLRGGNNEKLHPNDTYANVGDIVAMLKLLQSAPITVEIHYDNRIVRKAL